jgi:tetratricopeptide (TPR) repeat protein
MLLVVVLLAAGLVSAQETTWQADIAARDYDRAVDKLQVVANADDPRKRIEALRGLALIARLRGHLDEAADFLSKAVRLTTDERGRDSLEVADLFSELGMVYRAAGKRDEAIGTLTHASHIRGLHPSRDGDVLARDLTLLGLLQIAAEDKLAAETLTRALKAWDTAVPPDDVRILVVLDALGGLYRDQSDYLAAEPLFVRALSLREFSAGTDAADLIATLDSLAYVYFGQKKFTEAEPYYKRLLSAWETSAGREHPMVALTLEKMGVFYSAQEKYAEAEPLFDRSLDIRMKALLQSINHKGRAQVMQEKWKDAEVLYKNSVAMADSFKVSEELMDPMLRVYMGVMKELGKVKEAKALDDRIRGALIRKADREGKRLPAPQQ